MKYKHYYKSILVLGALCVAFLYTLISMYSNDHVYVEAQTIPPSSVVVATASVTEHDPFVIHSGDNNALIGYLEHTPDDADTPANKVMIQKFDYEGANVWGSATEMDDSTDTSGEYFYNVQLYPDGLGGAFVIYEQRPNPGSPEYKLLVSRVNSAGAPVFAPIQLFSTLTLSSTDIWSADSEGTSLFVGVPNGNTVYGQTIALDGTTLGSDAVIDADSNSKSFVVVEAVSGSNAVYFWVDQIEGKIFAEHFNNSAVSLWGDKVEIYDSAFLIPTYLKSGFSNYNNTAYITFLENNSVYIAGITTDGSTVLSSTQVSDQTLVSNQQISTTKTGDIIVSWQKINSDADLYFQRLDNSLQKQLGTSGSVITTSTGNQSGLVMASDHEGGAITLWTDEGHSDKLARMQRVNWDNSLDFSGDDTLIDGTRTSSYIQSMMSVDTYTATTGVSYAFIAYSERNDETADDGDVYMRIIELPDLMPPVTEYTVAPTDCSGVTNWCSDEVIVTLSTEANASTFYSTDGSSPTIPYSTSIVINTDTTLKYYSSDVNGNDENEKSLDFNFDMDDPETTIAPIFTPSVTYINTDFNITLSATDTTSGIANTYYRYDSGDDWSEYTSPLPVATDGPLYIEYYSEDVAGNTETVKNASYFKDKVKPTLNPSFNFRVTSGELNTYPVFDWDTVEATDDPSPSSGLQNICIQAFDEIDTQVLLECFDTSQDFYTSTTEFTPGNYEAHAYLTDIAGNASDPTARIAFYLNPNGTPNMPTELSPDNSTLGGDTTTYDNIDFSWRFADPDSGDNQSEYNLQIVEYDTVTNILYDSNWQTLSTINGELSSVSIDVNSGSTILQPGTDYKWRVKVKDSPVVGFEKESDWSTFAEFTTNHAPTPPTNSVLSTSDTSPTIIGESSIVLNLNTGSDIDGHVPLAYTYDIGTYSAGSCQSTTTSPEFSNTTVTLDSLNEGAVHCLTFNVTDSEGMPGASSSEMYFITYNGSPEINSVSLCRFDGSCQESIDLDTGVLSSNFEYKLSVDVTDEDINRVEIILDDVTPVSGIGSHIATDIENGLFYFYDEGYVPYVPPMNIGDITVISAGYTDNGGNSYTVEYLISFEDTWMGQSDLNFHIHPLDDDYSSGNDTRTITWSPYGNLTFDFDPPETPTVSIDVSDHNEIVDHEGIIYSRLFSRIHATHSIVDTATRYEYAVGKPGDITSLVSWNELTTSPDIDPTGLSLAHNNTYNVSVRAVDAYENVSGVQTTNWTTDFETPQIVSPAHSYTAITNNNLDITFNIDNTYSALSGISEYTYNIVEDYSDINNTSMTLGWQTAPTYPVVVHDFSASPVPDGTYYIVLRAKSNVGFENTDLNESGIITIDTINNDLATPEAPEFIFSLSSLTFDWTVGGAPAKVLYGIGDNTTTPNLTGTWIDTGNTTDQSNYTHSFGSDTFVSGNSYYVMMKTEDALGNESDIVFDSFEVDTETPYAPANIHDLRDLSVMHDDIDYDNRTGIQNYYISWENPVAAPPSGIASYNIRVYSVDPADENNLTPVSTILNTLANSGTIELELNNDTQYKVLATTIGVNGKESSTVIYDAGTITPAEYSDDLMNDRIVISDGLYIDTVPVTLNLYTADEYIPQTDSIEFDWNKNEDGAPLVKFEVAIGTAQYPDPAYESEISFSDQSLSQNTTIGSLSLTNGTPYYVTLRFTDAANNVHIDPAPTTTTPDSTEPVLSPIDVVLNDTTIFHDSTYYTSTPDAVMFTISAADDISGISGYYYQLFDENNNPLLGDYYYVDTDQNSYELSVDFSAYTGEYFYIKIKAENGAGIVSTMPELSPHVYVDLSDPEIATLSLTNAESYDSLNYILDRSNVEIDITASDIGAGLEKYVYQIRGGTDFNAPDLIMDPVWAEYPASLDGIDTFSIDLDSLGVTINETAPYHLVFKAVDRVGKESEIKFTIPFYVDTQNPSPVLINDGLPAFTNATDTLSAAWESPDPETGKAPVTQYEYSIGLVPYPTGGYDSLVPATVQADASISEALTLLENTDYFITVRSMDVFGRMSEYSTSEPIHTDWQAPTDVIPHISGEFSFYTSTLRGYIDAPSTDNNSGLGYYEYAIGTEPWSASGSPDFNSATNIFMSGCNNDGSGWQRGELGRFEVDNSFYLINCIRMTDGNDYYVSMRAVDRAGNRSGIHSSDTTIRIDTTAPSFSANTQIYDNETERSYHYTESDASSRTFTQFNDSLFIKYKASDPDYTDIAVGEDGIERYDYAIGLSTSDTSHRTWTQLPMDACVDEPGLYCASVSTLSTPEGNPLNQGTNYIIHIRATNLAGNGFVYRSGPLIFDSTPPQINIGIGDYFNTTRPFSNDEKEYGLEYLLSDNISGLANYRLAVGTEAGPIGSIAPFNADNWNSMTQEFHPQAGTNIVATDDRSNPTVFILKYSVYGTQQLVQPLSHGEYYYGSIHIFDKAYNETLYTTNGSIPNPDNPATVQENSPTLVDLTRPSSPSTASIDLATSYASSAITELPISFGPSSDPETGIYRYEYAIYQVHTATFMEGFENKIIPDPDTRSFMITDLNLVDGEYQVWIRAVNNTNPWSKDEYLDRSYSNWTKSESLIIDNTPPESPEYIEVINEDEVPIVFSNENSKLNIGFPDAIDGESGIDRYQYAISNFNDFDEDSFIVDWSNMNNYDIEDSPAHGNKYEIFYDTFQNDTDYYIYVRAQNNAGLWSDANVTSAPIRIDLDPPSNPNGLFEGTAGYTDSNNINTDDYWGENYELPFGWDVSTDTVSGISHYNYQIIYKNSFTSSYEHPVTDWLMYSGDLSRPYFVEEDIHFIDGKTYFIKVRAIDNAGNESDIIESDGILIDSTAPSRPWVYLESNYTSTVDSIYVSWDGEDQQSGIKHYYVKVYNQHDDTVWPDKADADFKEYKLIEDDEYTFDLSDRYNDGDHFYFEVYAENNAGIISDKGVSTALYVDTTPPVVQQLGDPDDGFVDIRDEGVYTNQTEQLTFNWITYDDDSGIDEYWYALGTGSSHGADGWNDTVNGDEGDGWAVMNYDMRSGSNMKSYTLNRLNLEEGKTYYFYLIAINKAGLRTPILKSNGITVDNAAPVTVLKPYMDTPDGEMFNKQIILKMSSLSNNDVAYTIRFDSEEFVRIPPKAEDGWDSVPDYWTIKYSNTPLGAYDTENDVFEETGDAIDDLPDIEGGIDSEEMSPNIEVIIVRDDFSERSHMVVIQAVDDANNTDQTPETYTWRVGESMKMYSTNWFKTQGQATGHRQTAVPNAPVRVIDDEGETDQFYRIMVGPQSFATAIITLSEGGVVRDTGISEFQSPISIRPRSLFGAEIPDLVMIVPGVAGEMLSFNQSAPDGESALRYDPDKDLNFDANGDVNPTDLIPFELKDNTGNVPEETRIVIEVPVDLRNIFRPDDQRPIRFDGDIELYKNSLRISTGGEYMESVEVDGELIEIPTKLYNITPYKLYDEVGTLVREGMTYPKAGWDPDEMEIVASTDLSTSSYLVDKFVNLENLAFGPFNDVDANKFKLTPDGYFNFALAPQDTKIAGKNLVLEVMMKVVMDKESDDEEDEYYYMKPFKIIFTIEPNVPSMINDEFSPDLDPSDTTHIDFQPTEEE